MFILLKFIQGHVKIRVVGNVSTSLSMWFRIGRSMSNKLICRIVCFCDGNRRDPLPQSESMPCIYLLLWESIWNYLGLSYIYAVLLLFQKKGKWGGKQSDEPCLGFTLATLRNHEHKRRQTAETENRFIDRFVANNILGTYLILHLR